MQLRSRALRGRCIDPDGATRAGYKCPSVEEKSKLYLAAWEDRVVGGNTRYVAAKLGLVPNDPGGHVFTSPDGRLREITVSANGTTAIDVDTGFEVFAGITCARTTVSSIQTQAARTL